MLTIHDVSDARFAVAYGQINVGQPTFQMYANVYIFMQQQSITCKVVLHLACTCLNKSYVNMYATLTRFNKI